MSARPNEQERGLALLAVLFALTLLMLLALPFAVSMSVGADAAMRDVEQTATEQASASVRDLLLADVALSHPAFDETPDYDDLNEWPVGVDLPEAFDALRENGRVLLGGEVEDLQRFLSLDSASPLLLANVIGTATRLTEDLEPDATAMVVDDASRLPEEGFLWVANEVVSYDSKDGNSLLGVQRGLLQDLGFADGTSGVREQSLVIDYRCMLAVIWPFFGPGRDGKRVPYSSVGELLEIQQAEMGAFTSAEMDAFARVFAVDAQAESAPSWGRPERVFNDLQGGLSRRLMVKSAVHLGAGSTVRIRNLENGSVEYGVLVRASTQRPGRAQLQLPSVFQLDLLMPVQAAFPAVDTVVEPLVPSPVNVNTASREVLTAVMANVRRSDGLRIPADNQRRSTAPPNISRGAAEDLADELVQMRGPGGGAEGGGAFTGWQNLVTRFFAPKVQGSGNNVERNKWLDLYRNMRTGRDSVLEMGTAPVCFKSGPLVKYRAAASKKRSVVAPGVVGRHERTGSAAILPGFRVERQWETQVAFEDAFVLDRRSPGWLTSPVNLGHLQPNSTGNDPASRYFPHLVPVAYPGMGLGAPRFAVDDPADSGVEPATSIARRRQWRNTQGQVQMDSFAQNINRRGRDVQKEGPYLMNNTGPMAPGGQPQQGGNRRHDQISFPFSVDGGFMGRFATSFWLEPQTLANQILFDHGDGDPDRNRLSVLGRDGNLVFEVLDEAGVDPNPSESPAGVQRTAVQVNLPLAELGLPANTPVHLNVSAPTGRPGDMTMFVDGMTRGKRNYCTYLAAPIAPFDPTLQNNATGYGQDPNQTNGNDRYINITVESAENFPPVGVLRIGRELFEYSSINGNTFACEFRDSLGGRGARQSAREHRPSIPVDENGRPTVDFNDPQFDGVNLDVFPEHPVGSLVELYGYGAVLTEDTPMMVGKTALDGQLGQFAVARAFVSNPDPISLVPLQGPPIPIGFGIDENWTGDLELADPIPSGQEQPPPNASDEIAGAFSLGGGYALLIQERIGFQNNTNGQLSGTTTEIGGIELVKYASRQGTKLVNVQRAQTLPARSNDANRIDQQLYDQTARKFVTDYNNSWQLANGNGTWDDLPTRIVWVVPVSIAVQNTSVLWDPATTNTTEWVQLYQPGQDVDLEWVRYDTIADNQFLVRGNTSAWRSCYQELTRSTSRQQIGVGQLGPQQQQIAPTEPPWGTVQPTSDFIGYTPQLESTYPQIHWARRRLAFRGDSFTGTSSHPQTNAQVTQCHRVQLLWGGANTGYSGRVGRHDRVALVQGSVASGTARPAVEWHTATWAVRRFGSDNVQPDRAPPPELFGPRPFQLIAFRDEVRNQYIGPPGDAQSQIRDPRQFDRIVKFPSGELPAAFCPNPAIGGGVSGEQPIQGVVDEVEVVQHIAPDLVLEEVMDANAQQLVVLRRVTYNSVAAWGTSGDFLASFPEGGGLIQVDDEIMAYTARNSRDQNTGVIELSANGRGLLNTEPRGHDRGARVKFLSQRPAAILAGGVGGNESVLTVQDLSPLPIAGTLLMGQELLHYTWSRNSANTLEMPNWYPPNPDGTVDASSSAARGLFRGRYGTAPQGASTGDVVIQFPFRHWDRYADFSDDPELSYFQITTNEAPVFYRDLQWREETTDPRVRVICRVRTDSLAPWTASPESYPGLWEFSGGASDSEPHRIARQASRLEVRFHTVYQPGCVDLQAFTQHGWKTSARVEDVRVQYEGQSRILNEEVTAR
ncbi:MAG: hypothetical protein VX044_07455 [Planctomycetota bacterium]|nr:hypothetical protein [Planctomycetota bacterium]